MPVLDISPDKMLVLNAISLDGAMIYPNSVDDEIRKKYVVCCNISVYADLREEDGGSSQFEIPLEHVNIILHSSSLKDLITMSMKKGDDGLDAGTVLVTLQQQVNNGVKEPSLRKSYAYLCKTLHKKRSIKTLREHFEKYRNVAHLWAAMLAMLIGCKTTLFEIRNNPKLFSAMLSLSEKYRIFGENFTSSRDKSGPLLDSSTTWKVPPVYPAYDISLPDFINEEYFAKVLSDYRR